MSAVRSHLSDVSAGQKLKRAHNSQRARNVGPNQNYSQKQFYTTQQFSNLASSQSAFKNSNPQIMLSQQAGKNVSSSQQRKNLQIAGDISGHKSATAQLKPTNIAAKAIMNSDGRQRSRNPPTALQGHAQSHTALLSGGLTNASGYPHHGAPGNMDMIQVQDQQQFQSNPSQQQVRQLGVAMSNQAQPRPMSSTQRSNMKSIQTTKTLKTTLSKSQVEARGMPGASRDPAHSSEVLTASQNYHGQQMTQSNQMKRTDSLSQSYNQQPFKTAGGGHPQAAQSQLYNMQGGIPGGTQTAQLQGIAKLIEPESGDLPGGGSVEYTQSKYRKRLNQQQSHDYQTGAPIAGGPKSKLALQAPAANQGRATKKLMAIQHGASTQQPPGKLVSTHIAQSQTQRTQGHQVRDGELSGSR